MYDIQGMYLRTEQAARFLSVSRGTLYKMIRDGVFTSVRQEASRGFGGKPAYEIAKAELEEVRAKRLGRKRKPVEIVEPIEKVVEKTPDQDKEELRKLLQDLQTAMVLQAEVLGKLLERLI